MAGIYHIISAIVLLVMHSTFSPVLQGVLWFAWWSIGAILWELEDLKK